MKHIIKKSSFLTLMVLLFLASCAKEEVTEETKVTLNETTKNLILGQIDSLFATISSTREKNTVIFSWTSSNEKVVTVKNGEIIGVSVGTAIISVHAGKELASCEVKVDDKISPKFTQGEFDYYGVVYEPSNSNNFIVYLGSAGINLTDLSGDGEILVLEFNTSLSAINNIPAGIYEMMSDSIVFPNTLVPAYFDDINNYEWGCWYSGATFNEMILGNAVISVENNIYTIQYNLIDYYGNSISGTYQGALNYFDLTSTSVSSSVKNKTRAGQAKQTRKGRQLNRILKFLQ